MSTCDDVRERSPLHEVGDGDWLSGGGPDYRFTDRSYGGGRPVGRLGVDEELFGSPANHPAGQRSAERNKFRTRVIKRSNCAAQTNRGPMVGRHPSRPNQATTAPHNRPQHSSNNNNNIYGQPGAKSRYGDSVAMSPSSSVVSSPEFNRRTGNAIYGVVNDNCGPGVNKSPSVGRINRSNNNNNVASPQQQPVSGYHLVGAHPQQPGCYSSAATAVPQLPGSPPTRPSRLPVVSVYNPRLTTSMDIGKQQAQSIARGSGRAGSKSAAAHNTNGYPINNNENGHQNPQHGGRTNAAMPHISQRRTSSPTILVARHAGKRSAAGGGSPKRGDVSSYSVTQSGRRVSSPTVSGRLRRSPSMTRSRPASPKGHGSRNPSPKSAVQPRRNPSPSQLDPEQADALRKRLGKARKVKLYLLQQSGSNSFLVAGEEPNQKYKVNIGPQTCSCGKGPGCLHLLFIMLRVFKIPENDSRLTARELKEFEIEALFRSHEERKKIRVKRSRQQSSEQLFALLKEEKNLESGPHNSQHVLMDMEPEDFMDSTSAEVLMTESTMDIMHQDHTQGQFKVNDVDEGRMTGSYDEDLEEDAFCPICLSEMLAGEEALTCCSSCCNYLHHHCMHIWAEECQNQAEDVLCPLCRSAWNPVALPVVAVDKKTEARTESGYAESEDVFHGYPDQYCNGPILNGGKQQRILAGNVSSETSSSGYSTISRTSDTLHMIEQGGCPEDIPLPKAEPIPQQHWHLASSWITVYGRDLVACLFSRDWLKRETALRRLAREVVCILQAAANNSQLEYSEKVDRAWKCCADMLSLMIEDKVYKVYLAAIKTLRALLNFLVCTEDAQVATIRQHVRPLLQSILIKCADGNRRISEVSTDCLLEFCKGQQGEMALGRYSTATGHHHINMNGVGGIDSLLHIILDDKDVSHGNGVSWQWIMGRLVCLQKMLTVLPAEFMIEDMSKGAQQTFGSNKLTAGPPKLSRSSSVVNLNRLMMIIDFSFQNLNSSHANVSKLARRVFTVTARNTAADSTVFGQVWDLLGALDNSLQLRMRKSLAAAVEELFLGESTDPQNPDSSSSASSMTSSLNLGEEKTVRSPQEQDRYAFLERFLNECSNQHSEVSQLSILPNKIGVQRKKGWRPPLMRSTSHSPSRQYSDDNRSSSQSPSRINSNSYLKLRNSVLCQSVSNINQVPLSVAKQGRPSSNFPAPHNKPRVLNRLAQKSRVQELAREVLPKFDLTFLQHGDQKGGIKLEEAQDNYPPDPRHVDPQDDKHQQQDGHPLSKSRSMTKLRSASPSKSAKPETTVRSPNTAKKNIRNYNFQKGASTGYSRITTSSTACGSPNLRDKRSCKDSVDYEEHLALAKALSKSIYQETPLPVIPGLSQHLQHSSITNSQDVLAHPQRDIMEEANWKREYREGVDWTKGTVLGTGAYSTCYQARDVETGTLMAAKQISFCRNSDEEQDKVEQLIREEVLLLSKLKHPQIVRMYGAIQEGSHINVFEEWMPGGSIAGLLDKHGQFTESVIIRYTHQILLGLDYLHSNGVLHRDLKGANLLVDTSGHHLRIADFGAAARMMSKATVPGEFQGQLQGTIAFMAPEVLRGDSYGRSCDIWSVGCCIIEMATTKPPWGASDVSNHLTLIFRIACAAEPPSVPSQLSPGLRDLVLRCLDLDPHMRPSPRELLLHPVFQEIQ